MVSSILSLSLSFLLIVVMVIVIVNVIVIVIVIVNNNKKTATTTTTTTMKYIGVLRRDAKSEEHEERAPAILPPVVLIFGLPTQKIC